MISERWFNFGGRQHIPDPSGEKAVCGLRPMNPPKIIVATAEHGEPPAPCRGCIITHGMTLAVDEPIEVARARGLRRGTIPEVD